MTTFSAPAARCWDAPSRSVKRPVDSMTTSTPMSFHGQRRGFALREHADGVAAHRDRVRRVLDVVVEHAEGRVVLEHVRQDVRRGQVVHGHDLEPGALLEARAVEVAPDPAEAVDPNFRRHRCRV